LIRVVIIADTLFRARSVAASLADDDKLEVLEANVFSSAREHGDAAVADVLVAAGLPLDQMPLNGPPVVAITNELVEEMPLGPSIRAWLPLSSSASQLRAAILAAANELLVLTEREVSKWFGGVRSRDGDDGFDIEGLTPREMQVLRMLADGLGNKEIAGQLHISDHTAKFHVAQILAKLRAASRTEAVAIGMRRGLVPI
jgi:DNA-binding CsgD family transcriptional regulator